MYPICYQWVSGRYFQPEPAMYSRCFHWFPGPLAPSEAIFEGFPDLHNPTIPCYSTVVGHRKFTEQFTADYLWENLRNPVHFHQAIPSILEDHPAVFIEISPPPCPLFLCLSHWCLVRSSGVPVSQAVKGSQCRPLGVEDIPFLYWNSVDAWHQLDRPHIHVRSRKP